MNTFVTKCSNWFQLLRLNELLLLLPLNIGILVLLPSFSIINGLRYIIFLSALIFGYLAGNVTNALTDIDIDKENPRTKDRPLVKKNISKKQACIVLGVDVVFIILFTYLLNPFLVLLLPIPIFIGIVYCFSKRYTYFCHFILGITAAVGPFSVGIVFEENWLCLLSILCASYAFFHISTYDIGYSIQDIDYDKKFGTHSLPVKFGKHKAKLFSHILCVVSYVILLLLGYLWSLSIIYYLGLICMIIVNVVQIYLLNKEKFKASFYLNFCYDTIFMFSCIFGRIVC